MKKILSVVLASLAAGVILAEDEAQTRIVPTVAVLNFEARDRSAANSDMGKSAAELLSLALQESGCADLVERAELNRALEELHLSSVGLTDKSSQVKLGRLVGAKILLTGSLFKSGDNNTVVVKIIGTETSRVFAASVTGTKDFSQLIPELAPKVSAVLNEQSEKLLPKPETAESAADTLKSQVNGKQRKVAVIIKEDIHGESSESAAESELKKLLLALNFQIVDDPREADFVVRGSAEASNAGMYRNFHAAAARVDFSVNASGERLLAKGAANEVVAGATYAIAAKDAIAKAALHLAVELFVSMK